MISTKGRYAIRVMIDLAENDQGHYIPLKDIAARQEISKKYLEIICKEMVAGGLIIGSSGKGGGYRLCRKPEEYTLDEILEKINEKYKGNFTDADRVVIQTLHDKLITDQKLKDSARTTDPRIFTESIFPRVFSDVLMESYMQSQESYSSFYEDQAKYDALKSALAGILYREMRSGNGQ